MLQFQEHLLQRLEHLLHRLEVLAPAPGGFAPVFGVFAPTAGVFPPEAGAISPANGAFTTATGAFAPNKWSISPLSLLQPPRNAPIYAPELLKCSSTNGAKCSIFGSILLQSNSEHFRKCSNIFGVFDGANVKFKWIFFLLTGAFSRQRRGVQVFHAATAACKTCTCGGQMLCVK